MGASVNVRAELARWLWECIGEFSQEQRRLFLQFVWGRSRMPTRMTESFSVETLSAGNDADSRLPMAATCFFKLRLPPYTNKQALVERLTCALP